jgi:hypothetical protein
MGMHGWELQSALQETANQERLKVEILMKQNRIMKAALEFYGEEKNHIKEPHIGSGIDRDGGKIARGTLQRINQLQGIK